MRHFSLNFGRTDDSVPNRTARVTIINVPFLLRQTNLMKKENQYFSEMSAFSCLCGTL